MWHRIWESNPDHIGGRRVLSPLHHPCTPKAKAMKKINNIEKLDGLHGLKKRISHFFYDMKSIRESE